MLKPKIAPGCTGSTAVLALLEQGYPVRAFVRRSHFVRRSLAEFQARAAP